MKSINALLIVTIFTSIFAGCVGDSTDNTTTAVEDSGPDWINDVGTNDNLWSISLEQDQWLEVKIATTIINAENENLSYPVSLLSDEKFVLNPSVSSYSPKFGGSYSLCVMMMEGICVVEDPDGDWEIKEWSIIYRIHEV